MDNKPRLAFNAGELELVKATFAENETLLRTIRKVFLGGELTETQKSELKAAFEGKTELQELMRVFFLPIVRDETPLGMGLDMWNGLQIAEKGVSDAMYLIKARKITIKVLDRAIDVLFSLKGTSGYETLLDECSDDEMYINIIARQSVSGHINQKTMELLTLAGKKTETADETVQRLWKNSAK